MDSHQGVAHQHIVLHICLPNKFFKDTGSPYIVFILCMSYGFILQLYVHNLTIIHCFSVCLFVSLFVPLYKFVLLQGTPRNAPIPLMRS